MAEREAELARLELIRRKGVVISDSDEEDSDAARRSVSAQLRPSHSPAAAKPTPKYLGAVTTPEPSSHGSDTSSGSPASNGDSQEDLPDFILDEEECDEENRMIVEEHRARARAATQGLPFHIKVCRFVLSRCAVLIVRDRSLSNIKSTESSRPTQTGSNATKTSRSRITTSRAN